MIPYIQVEVTPPKQEYVQVQKEYEDYPHIEREQSSIVTSTGSVIGY